MFTSGALCLVMVRVLRSAETLGPRAKAEVASLGLEDFHLDPAKFVCLHMGSEVALFRAAFEFESRQSFARAAT